MTSVRAAGILESEKHGLFVNYYVNPIALQELADWLTFASGHDR